MGGDEGKGRQRQQGGRQQGRRQGQGAAAAARAVARAGRGAVRRINGISTEAAAGAAWWQQVDIWFGLGRQAG